MLCPHLICKHENKDTFQTSYLEVVCPKTIIAEKLKQTIITEEAPRPFLKSTVDMFLLLCDTLTTCIWLHIPSVK